MSIVGKVFFDFAEIAVVDDFVMDDSKVVIDNCYSVCYFRAA